MKPSERINQILLEMAKERLEGRSPHWDPVTPDVYIHYYMADPAARWTALMFYLDEHTKEGK